VTKLSDQSKIFTSDCSSPIDGVRIAESENQSLFVIVVGVCDQLFGIAGAPKLTKNFVMKATDQITLNKIF
jgi:hypothetical protein